MRIRSNEHRDTATPRHRDTATPRHCDTGRYEYTSTAPRETTASEDAWAVTPPASCSVTHRPAHDDKAATPGQGPAPLLEARIWANAAVGGQRPSPTLGAVGAGLVTGLVTPCRPAIPTARMVSAGRRFALGAARLQRIGFRCLSPAGRSPWTAGRARGIGCRPARTAQPWSSTGRVAVG